MSKPGCPILWEISQSTNPAPSCLGRQAWMEVLTWTDSRPCFYLPNQVWSFPAALNPERSSCRSSRKDGDTCREGGQGRRASDDPAPPPSEIMVEGTGQRVKCLRALKFWEHLGLSGDGTISQHSLVTDGNSVLASPSPT